ncbi:MAG: RNase adaptor protein RapZ [Candidatus Rokubacteria bacterium RIFCSPHIGHO2_12_FULL_73_22]|nr:MAG: RNase adaptor protein RapZ [Candidatus Rokubacteria bacterium RIFCSPHIGHO2_12_FULL_73_22]OGL00698.1 MAG: RNase adaptor protein RapZ [Candidatus Rokubacteria bacterium RIFCSPHIGHO2_02_FULL_73_26]OGL09269.1 MAG: RNase adaptor protein RapZ [Candidatus Rokubacteria bacterium RIFCSPLOWO2_02_FULL_73_56]OGL29112.1 MAG: RNase adaptor protein RapZ [Candidatus Rokubacteria bacterium RIFCSPLOWO2_12_FULL_73_47]
MDERVAFVVITGLSGAGKSYAIKCFEDMGYFCVDNLPTTLIPTFADLTARSTQAVRRVALGVDVREGEYLSHLLDALGELRTRGHRVEVLFMEASDEALVRRYSETRRRHPLARDGSVLDGIRAERKALSHMREVADRVLDTSALTVHQLKDRLVELYGGTTVRPGLAPALVSFGFKYGTPYDADLVFDVRFLPNPHFVEALRPLDGRDPRLRVFVLERAEAQELLRHLTDFLKFLLPLYEREGKAYLTVAVGCTGGRHRSVVFVEELRGVLEGLGYTPTVVHRDLERE